MARTFEYIIRRIPTTCLVPILALVVLSCVPDTALGDDRAVPDAGGEGGSAAAFIQNEDESDGAEASANDARDDDALASGSDGPNATRANDAADWPDSAEYREEAQDADTDETLPSGGEEASPQGAGDDADIGEAVPPGGEGALPQGAGDDADHSGYEKAGVFPDANPAPIDEPEDEQVPFADGLEGGSSAPTDELGDQTPPADEAEDQPAAPADEMESAPQGEPQDNTQDSLREEDPAQLPEDGQPGESASADEAARTASGADVSQEAAADRNPSSSEGRSEDSGSSGTNGEKRRDPSTGDVPRTIPNREVPAAAGAPVTAAVPVTATSPETAAVPDDSNAAIIPSSAQPTLAQPTLAQPTPTESSASVDSARQGKAGAPDSAPGSETAWQQRPAAPRQEWIASNPATEEEGRAGDQEAHPNLPFSDSRSSTAPFANTSGATPADGRAPSSPGDPFAPEPSMAPARLVLTAVHTLVAAVVDNGQMPHLAIGEFALAPASSGRLMPGCRSLIRCRSPSA